MSNFNLNLDKQTSHLEELKRKHKDLDKQIKECYSAYDNDDNIIRLKTMKLYLKDEIHRIETELGLL